MMPFENDEDPEELMAKGIMPNTPRDPEKDARRAKMEEFLRPRMAPDRSAMQPLQESNDNLALINLFNQSANQAGTIGGKSASSTPLTEFTGRLAAGNNQRMGQMEKDRSDMRSDEDRQLKLLQYFQTSDDASRKEKAKSEYDSKMLKLREKEVNQKGDKTSGANEGLKALDKDYAKDYNDWTSTGRSGYEKNLKLLNDAKAELSSKKGDTRISGNIMGRLPDIARSEDSKVVQQKVQAAAVGAMKAALGAAFTEKEGTRIMNLSYDPTLSPEQNLTKIDEAIADLESKAADQEGKSRYFEKGQTLKDYKAPAGKPPAGKQPPGQKPVDQMSIEELQAELGG